MNVKVTYMTFDRSFLAEGTQEPPRATCRHPLRPEWAWSVKGAKGQSAGVERARKRAWSRGQAHLGDGGRGLSLQGLSKRKAQANIQDRPRGSVERQGQGPGQVERSQGKQWVWMRSWQVGDQSEGEVTGLLQIGRAHV